MALGFVIAPAPAFAVEPPFDFCSVAIGELGGECRLPRGLAVNEDGNGGVPAGTVYLADFENRRVQSFDADGNFIRAWGKDVVTGGSTGFEICELAAECRRGEHDPTGEAGNFNRIAGGIAVNQATGDVYVVDRNNYRVQQFSATGNFIRAWGKDVDSTGGAGFEICEVGANCKAGVEGSGAGMLGQSGALAGIGVDSSGNVYIADAFNSRVQKFSSVGNFLRMGGWDVDAVNPATGYEVCTVAVDCKAGTPGSGAGQFAGQNPNHLAVDADGDIYVVDPANAKVVRLDSALALAKDPFAPAVVNGEGVPRAIAVNWVDGHVLLAKSATEKVYEIDPVSEEPPGAPTLFGAPNWSGLAINSTNGWIYAASGQMPTPGHIIRVRELLRTLFAVTVTPATSVTDTAATLHGNINPGGDPVGECVFEYVDNDHYDPGSANPYESGETVPCAESNAEIGEGITSVPVHVDLSGLHPGTGYHFRVFARNALPEESFGADATFQTLGPVIADSWAQDVGLGEARPRARINPEGEETTYRFEYGTQGPCSANPCTSVPIPDGAVGSGGEEHEVGAQLEGLDQGTTYDWHVVATNASAVNIGPDRIFTTYRPLNHAPCANDAFRVGPSAALPGCRAYEMVSPLDKGGGNISVPSGSSFGRVAAYRQASLDGNRVTYTSGRAFGDAVRATISNQYLATRHPPGDPQEGWSTHALYPPQGTTVFDPKSNDGHDLDINFQAFTSDLCFALMRDHNLVPLDPAALAGFTNLYLRDNCGLGADSYQALTVGEPPTFGSKNLLLEGRNYSTDLGHVVFTAKAALTPNATQSSVTQIYERHSDPVDALQKLTVKATSGQYTLTARAARGRGGLSSGSATVTEAEVVSPGGAFHVGDAVSGAGIPAGTTVVEVGEGTLTLSQAATASGEEVELLATETTAPINATASAVEVQSALEALAAIGAGNVGVSGGPGDETGSSAYSIAFGGSLAGIPVAGLVANDLGLGGGSPSSSATVVIAEPGGQLRLVSLLPGGEASTGVSEVGSAGEAAHDSNLSRAVSADGSRVFWTSSKGGFQTIYARIDGEQTLQLSGTGSDVVFWTASTDGARAVFSEGSLSFADADLYEFDVDKALAEEAAKTLVAGKVGGVVGASGDLSRLYFSSEEVLDPSPNSQGDVAVAGERNLYLRREGAVRFVATLAAADEGPYGADGKSPSENSSRVSPEGRYLAFMSKAPLTGYDNTDPATGEAVSEVYRYDAEASGGASELRCASCNPSGARPLAQDPRAPYSLHNPAGFRVAAWLPTSESANYAKRSLPEDGGRLFFHAFDALVPEDENGAQDVYQWEAPGTGSCDVEDPRYFAANGGCLYLISTGKSTEESELLDATPDGRDVFITTVSSIDPRDLAFVDIYDARVGGGFPPPPPLPPACVGDACQPIPVPPSRMTSAGMHFRGPGDPSTKPKGRRCPQGKRRVHRAGKVYCVKHRQGARHKQRVAR